MVLRSIFELNYNFFFHKAITINMSNYLFVFLHIIDLLPQFFILLAITLTQHPMKGQHNICEPTYLGLALERPSAPTY